MKTTLVNKPEKHGMKLGLQGLQGFVTSKPQTRAAQACSRHLVANGHLVSFFPSVCNHVTR